MLDDMHQSGAKPYVNASCIPLMAANSSLPACDQLWWNANTLMLGLVQQETTCILQTGLVVGVVKLAVTLAAWP